MAETLNKKAASGFFWMAVQKYSRMLVGFISGIILARLLTPFDYGCIGMLAIFVSLAETFITMGFGSALIQKKRPTQEDYSTVFFWNLGMSVLTYAILFFSAPAIARFYEIPILCKVLRVQGLILFIYAFNIIQRNRLHKSMNFKLLSIVSVGSSIIALGITIWMAYRGYGVWALVAQHLIIAAIPSLVFWFYVKWRPSLVFSTKSFKELFGFGFFMFLRALVNNFCNRIQGLLIGKIYNPSTLGYYTKAQDTENLASTSISSVLMQVTYPLYSELQDDMPKLKNMLKRLTVMIAYITIPLLFLLILCARPIFILMYSERWVASIPYFQVLCLAGMAACLHAVQLQSIAAIGKSKVIFYAMLVKRSVGLLAIVGGLYLFGMKGLLVGVVINHWFSYAYNAGLLSRYIGYSFREHLSDLLPIFLISLLAFAACYFGVGLLHLGLYMDGLLKALVFVSIIVAYSLIFKPDAFRFTREFVEPYLSRLFSRLFRKH